MTCPTDREREILIAVAEHGSMKAAAFALGLKQQTVKNYLHALYRRCGYQSAAQAIYAMLREERAA